MVIVTADPCDHLLGRPDRHAGTFLHMLLLYHLAAALLGDRAAQLDGLADRLVGAGLARDGLAGGGGAVATATHLVVEVTIAVCCHHNSYLPFHS